MQCPLPESGAAQGTLCETQQQIAEVGARLGAGSENEIAQVIASLRMRHPTASQGEIVNYLDTGYCQKIKANSALNRDGKQDELLAFVGRVGQIAGKH
jgi:hypothetical protein